MHPPQAYRFPTAQPSHPSLPVLFLRCGRGALRTVPQSLSALCRPWRSRGNLSQPLPIRGGLVLRPRTMAHLLTPPRKRLPGPHLRLQINHPRCNRPPAPLPVLPSRLIDRDVVLLTDNEALVYRWHSRRVRHDVSASIFIRAMHLISALLYCTVFVWHLPRLSKPVSKNHYLGLKLWNSKIIENICQTIVLLHGVIAHPVQVLYKGGAVHPTGLTVTRGEDSSPQDIQICSLDVNKSVQKMFFNVFTVPAIKKRHHNKISSAFSKHLDGF